MPSGAIFNPLPTSLRITWDLRAQVLAFIDYYNRTLAKPFKWTYQGKALTA